MQRKICIKQYIVQKNDIPEDVLKIACVVVGFVFFLRLFDDVFS